MSNASYWADARRDTRRFIIAERSVRHEIEQEVRAYEDGILSSCTENEQRIIHYMRAICDRIPQESE
ncbi:MAG TPA: hypothetical protein VIG47_08580 [Gemmatimonadaceae bacterium]|jgi:hypothetical protein